MQLTFKIKKHIGEEPRPLDVCAVNKCRKPTEVIFLDIPLCDYHWCQHCKETEEIKNGNQSKSTTTLKELYPQPVPFISSIPILQTSTTNSLASNQPINNIPRDSPEEPTPTTECLQLQSSNSNKPLSPSPSNKEM